MTPEQRLRQSKVKLQIIAKREMREFLRGERDFLPGNLIDRTTLDAIKTAYAAGLRDGSAA